MYRETLRKVVEKLKLFEEAPKDIKGKQITEWFKIGEKIFIEFYLLGVSINWDFLNIKNNIEVRGVVDNITKNQEWLQTFVNLYPNLRIDLDLVGSAGDICKVRSGIEILLKGFVNVDTKFDKVLANLEYFGELEEFDRCLKIWIHTGHRPDFSSSDKETISPTSHWWWH